MPTLLDVARRYADAHQHQGVARTPFAGVSVLRETSPTQLLYAISRPLVALVLQGSKRVAIGNQAFEFSAGQSLVISADVPTVSQITQASAGRPYYAFVIELDLGLIEALVMEMGSAPFSASSGVRVEPTDAEVAQAALRLLNLLERPASVPILQGPLMRELHYWLLAGRHGGALRALGVPSSHARKDQPGDRADPRRIQPAAAHGAIGRNCWAEPVGVSRALSAGDHAHAVAVPEAVEVDRGKAASAGGAAGRPLRF
ncbi:AraC family transcriptional regulator [Pseudomonas sp. KNUC1026]|nr:AraC family transcriptional regulator [Pseudomonas sp. KNUC1026]UFH48870.1 AraC family transcriptional regulator [Pseudomonas sp. KNUC1026]